MTIKAEIVADSIDEKNCRITTFLLTYPRFIHSELMTHRVFSRNASSSRAIPIKTSVANIRKDMARPLTFLKNKPGMQGGEPLGFFGQFLAELLWYGMGHVACIVALLMVRLGIHKQYGNRILEPWSHITVVLTSTQWANWFGLRIHKDAQPEIRRLAEEMLYCLKTHEPKKLERYMWHLPFVDEPLKANPHLEPVSESQMALIYKSVAACARTSYLNHDKTNSTLDADKKLYAMLVGSSPMHASPAEHQAMCLGTSEFDWDFHDGNLAGWLQYRKFLHNETITVYDYDYDPNYDKGVQINLRAGNNPDLSWLDRVKQGLPFTGSR